jgi:hypothetical protein
MEAARDGDLPVIAHCVESGTPTDEGCRTATLHCHLPFLSGLLHMNKNGPRENDSAAFV